MATTATDTRAAVLDAALEVFARDGVPAARLEDVATAAGVTRATLYYHFHGKDAVVAALLDRAVGRLAAAVTAPVDAESPASATQPVRAIAAALLRAYAADQTLHRLLFTELWGPVLSGELFDDVEACVLGPITERLAEAMRAGEIRQADPRLAALALFGQVSAVALGAIIRGDALDHAALEEAIGDLAEAALRPGS